MTQVQSLGVLYFVIYIGGLWFILFLSQYFSPNYICGSKMLPFIFRCGFGKMLRDFQAVVILMSGIAHKCLDMNTLFINVNTLEQANFVFAFLSFAHSGKQLGSILLCSIRVMINLRVKFIILIASIYLGDQLRQ